MAASDYVDQAVEVVGGENTDFMLTAVQKDYGLVISLDCRVCNWGLTVGQMELWEFITDAREHWETIHAAPGQPHPYAGLGDIGDQLTGIEEPDDTR
jgi:hypothetical protein